MKKILFFYLFVIGFSLYSCSRSFKRGGYYFSNNQKSYYANDRKKIYFQFAEKFVYNEDNFNATQLSLQDLAFLEEFHIKPSRKILFTYHSFGRDMVAILEPKSAKTKLQYKLVEIEDGTVFLSKTTIQDSVLVVQNLFPFKNKYIRVIEKTRRTPVLKKEKEKSKLQGVYIFPSISSSKPF